MKLERISENKIRCTLDKTDLVDKQIHLHELAYGSDKAKALFSEMMQKASEELGFEAENIPLMVEAIPISRESLILTITKVEDPEELDARFSNFTKHPIEINLSEDGDSDYDDDSDGLFGDLIENTASILENIKDLMGGDFPADVKPSPKKVQKTEPVNVCCVFRFHNLDDVHTVANLTETLYNGENSLYKNPTTGQFHLLLNNVNNKDVYTKLCNILGEYGEKVSTTSTTPYYMQEHYKLILRNNALQTLTKL